MGRAWERGIDMNTHPDGHFCSVAFVVLKIFWKQFYGVAVSLRSIHKQLYILLD